MAGSDTIRSASYRVSIGVDKPPCSESAASHTAEAVAKKARVGERVKK